MIAFIGSGPHTLAAVAFLLQASPQLRSEVRVFDPSGAWLTQWDRQMGGQEIVHLRSSSVHHPDPDALALRRFAKGRFDEFYPPYFLPGTALFREFCDDVIRRFGLKDLVEPLRVDRLSRSERGMALSLSDGSNPTARAVVASLGGGFPVMPAWAPPAVSPTLVHSDAVDLRQLEPASGRIVIVGGGLTAGHLALGALKRGWQVDVVTRRPINYKLFDAAPGWIGPKYLAGYLRETDWQHRRKLVAKARGGGAMTEEIRSLLAPFRKSRQLTLRPRWPVVHVAPRDHQWEVRGRWSRSLVADRVWFCTGYKLDLSCHPLFQSLWPDHPLQVLDGLPVLDRDCQWPGLPLYLMGSPAALRVGPTARNFPGARQAASRIAFALTGIRIPPT